MPASQWIIGMGLTSKCNMKCSFCYSQDHRVDDDLPLEVWISFFNRNASLIKAINYGTGENTLCESWYQFIKHIRKLSPHIPQALTTNGYLFEAIKDPEKEDVITECIDEIDVSIDFASSVHQNQSRRFSSAYEMAVNTLGYCMEKDKRSTIVMLAKEETLDISNLTRLFDLAVTYNSFLRINIYRHVSKKSQTEPPSFNRVIKALDWIIENHTVVSISEPLFKSMYRFPFIPHSNHTESMRILPNGNITPSTYLITEEWVVDNIQNDVSLSKIVGTKPFRRYIRNPLPAVCASCSSHITCGGGTRDRRFLTWGNLDHPDPYCPQFAGLSLDTLSRPKPRLLKNNETVHSDYLPTMIFAPNRLDGKEAVHE